MSAGGDRRRRARVFVHFEPDDADLERRAGSLAAALALPLLDDLPAPVRADDLVLTVTPGGLELREHARLAATGVRVDLRAIERRPGRGRGLRRQPLARAVGRASRRVVDATAGLGRDAAILAFAGFEVIAVERSPVLAAMLEDGIERARADPFTAEALGDRLRVETGDARDVLARIAPPPDAVYLDPMYPPRRKASAIAKRGIRLVRALVGADADAGELLAAARARAADRVVVKRPAAAEPIGGAPSYTIAGKLARYDVYLTRGGAEPRPGAGAT